MSTNLLNNGQQEKQDAPNGGTAADKGVVQESAKATKMVTKRDGRVEEFSTDKLRKRMDQLNDGLATEYMGLDACLQKVSAYAHSGKPNHISTHANLSFRFRDHHR